MKQDNDDKTIIMRFESYVLLLDSNEYEDDGVVHLIIAFGKERIFHSKYEDDIWTLDDDGLIKSLDWNELKKEVMTLFFDAYNMGALYDYDRLKKEFNVYFSDDNLLRLIAE